MNGFGPEQAKGFEPAADIPRTIAPQEIGAPLVYAAIGENDVPIDELGLKLIEVASNGATTEEAAAALSIPTDEVESMRDKLIVDFKAPNMAAVISIAFSQRLIPFETKNPSIRISERDALILRLIAQGKSNRQIGSELGREPQAMRNLVKNLFNKMQVTGRTHSVRRAYEYGVFKVY